MQVTGVAEPVHDLDSCKGNANLSSPECFVNSIGYQYTKPGSGKLVHEIAQSAAGQQEDLEGRQSSGCCNSPCLPLPLPQQAARTKEEGK